MMLEEIKLKLRIQTPVFDQELLRLTGAAILDLRHVGVKFNYTTTTDPGTGAITDYQIPDLLINQAVTTYVAMNFGNPVNYDKLKESYEAQKGSLRESSAYGMEAL